MPDLCPRCERVKAESRDAWKREHLVTLNTRMYGGSGIDAFLAPMPMCGAHVGTHAEDGLLHSDCDRARIALLERENAKLKKRVLPELFPIMGGPAIPWAMIAPHEAQALDNHDQTLKRLAERGGLDPLEALAVLLGLKWREARNIPALDAKVRLAEIVRAYKDAPLEREKAELVELVRVHCKCRRCGGNRCQACGFTGYVEAARKFIGP